MYIYSESCKWRLRKLSLKKKTFLEVVMNYSQVIRT